MNGQTLSSVSRYDPRQVETACAQLDGQGFVLVTDAYTAQELAVTRQVLLAVENGPQDEGILRTPAGELWAIWNLYERSPLLMRLVLKPDLFPLVAAYLGEPAEFCRATLMCKVPGTQHRIPWHQDAGIAVDRELADAASLGLRDGVPHRVPEPGIMERMVAARVNLEAQREDAGCLMVIPGSHRWGQLPQAEVERRAGEAQPLLCPVPAGSILFYQQLLVHASGPSLAEEADNHRRVIHHEFHAASIRPSPPLNWWRWQHRARVEREGVLLRG